MDMDNTVIYRCKMCNSILNHEDILSINLIDSLIVYCPVCGCDKVRKTNHKSIINIQEIKNIND